MNDPAIIKRYSRWLDYYSHLLDLFGACRLVLIEDGGGGDASALPVFEVGPEQARTIVHTSRPLLIRFPERLGRISHNSFPGWWRSFSFAAVLARAWGLDKVIHIESDAFVLSPRMARHMKRIDHGWHAYWCPRWGFPETSLQVIAGKSLDELAGIHEAGSEFWIKPYGKDREAEFLLPFTNVHRKFTGDRYSDGNLPPPPRADYACQVRMTDVIASRLTRAAI